MAKRRVRSPDGREWKVRVHRIRMPAWHRSEHDPWEDGLEGFAVTLVRFLAELPVAAVRPLFTKTRWVQAASTWPSEMKLIWKSRASEAAAVADHVTEKLAEATTGLTSPVGSKLVYMTRPPGFSALTASAAAAARRRDR
jgi:hypothetical protein